MEILKAFSFYETEVIFVPMEFYWNCCSLHLCALRGLLLAIILFICTFQNVSFVYREMVSYVDWLNIKEDVEC
jgi:hypothetical protein